MRAIIAALILLSSVASLNAQAPDDRQEIGASGGFARITGEAVPVSSAWGGASYAVRAGRGYIKFDYEHFRRFFSNDFNGFDGPDQAERFHLLGVGWLIEWEPGSVRPFVHVGGIFGIYTSTFDGKEHLGVDPSPNLVGPAVSGGATINFSRSGFIRPELRWKLLGPGPIVPFEPGVTVGWRF